MKINIDLSEIFEDEENGKFHFPVKEQIIHGAIESVKDAISKNIKTQIAEQLNKLVESEVKGALAALIPNILDAEYQVTTAWGEPKEKTTVRAQLHKTIENQMVFKYGNYSSDRNAFTNAVHDAMKEELKKFKDSFNAEVSSLYKEEAKKYAVEKLREVLGIK